MPTAARIHSSESSHWYFKDGRPCYSVPYADPSKGMRPATLRDCKKLGLLPSVSTYLRCLDKPALNIWKQEMACLAVLTTPRQPNEALDAFVDRVLNVEKQQDQEAQAARDLGTDIHAALELALQASPFPDELNLFVLPVVEAIRKYGQVRFTEKIVVGDGYAGKTDLITEGDAVIVWDFKTTKKLPKESYDEHRLQTSAYAKAIGPIGDKMILTANAYLSTVEKGKFVIHMQSDWPETYEQGFKPVMAVWRWMNQFYG